MSSWSNWQLVAPQRTTALYIPEDIYHCIFAYFINVDVDRSLISALTRVCKFFAVIFMPVLLTSRVINLQLGHFSNALLDNNPVARSQILHVKRCIIFHPHVPTSSFGIPFFEPYAALPLSIIRALPSTLKYLLLENVAITDDIFTALHSLRNLTSLAIDTPIVSSKSASPPSQSTVKLDLESFSLYNDVLDATGHSSDILVIMRSLASFINFDSIRTLHINNSDILDAIIITTQNKTLPRIEELMCTVRDFREFLPFLAQVPNLTTLLIDVDYGTDIIILDPSDTSNLIPNLVTLRCPAPLVPFLISDRPVTDIDAYPSRFRVSGYEILESDDLIQFIRLSSVPIKVLRLPAYIYLNCSCLFGDAFPELEELDMTVNTPKCNTSNVRLSYSFHCLYYKQSFFCAFYSLSRKYPI